MNLSGELSLQFRQSVGTSNLKSSNAEGDLSVIMGRKLATGLQCSMARKETNGIVATA